jgi:dipeptidyl-peptidase-4
MLIPVLATLTLGFLPQDRLASMPGFERYDRMRREVGRSVVRGNLRVEWASDSKTFTYSDGGKKYRFDLATKKAVEIEAGGIRPAYQPAMEEPAALRGPLARIALQLPERGRQFGEVRSPDSKWTAVYRDRNVWLKPAEGREIQVTTEGSAATRVKYGQASWVYGEELNVRHAMWWSPDSKKLAFYRFDESPVKDYFLTLDQRQLRNRLDIEAYPKAGEPNPEVDLLVYDLASKKTALLDAHADLGAGSAVGYYLYDVRWSPDGKELLFNRTDRKQQIMEFCAANPESGKCRVVVRETWPTGWVENHPPIQYLDAARGQPRQFLWISERSGFQNIYLGDLAGAELKPVTQHSFEVVRILRVDQKNGQIYYLARSAPNPYHFQLHRVGLDGKGDVRMTDPEWHHTVDLAPDGKTFVDVVERVDEPPTTRLCDASGAVIDILKKSDMSKFEELGLERAEQLVFKAADGVTTLHGTLFKPSDFDPAKRYPLLVSTYGGPDSGGSAEDFALPPAITEFGFLYAQFEGRGTNGRGKAFKDAVYGKLGVVEVDDQAAGVRFLRERQYVDGGRIGIFGTSYGGYTSCLAILRHPDVFQAAVASSSVTDWRNYDTIYTERYMGLPQENENKKGYDEGSAMAYADKLKGRLLLYYGTADNNVHPTNTHQLIGALMRAGKSHDVQVGPDAGHSGLNQNRMWEYFVEHLILNPGR